MKYISFELFATFCILLSVVSGVQASSRLTGDNLKEIIRERAGQAGIELEAVISTEKVFYPCKDLKVVPKYHNWKAVKVICLQPYPWQLNIRTKITSQEPKHAQLEKRPRPKTHEKKAPKVANIKSTRLKTKEQPQYSYVVLAEPVSKGTVLNENIVFDLKDFHYKVNGGFRDINQVIGRKLKYPVQEGAPILARHLTIDYTVEKDTVLDIVVVRRGIKISGRGIALSNGQLGEIILVSNLNTGVKLKARIKNSHEAEIIAKHSQ